MTRELEFDDKGQVVLRFNPYFILKVIIISLLTAGSWFIDFPDKTLASQICLTIFVGAALLWVSELIPPFAVSLAVMVLCIYLLPGPDGPFHFEESGSSGYRGFLAPLSHPVLILFFAGFILQVAATKHGFDMYLARYLIRPFGKKPSRVLMGIIAVTALFSMFMSNTATAAMMIAVCGPLLRQFKDRPGFVKPMTLAIPFAANIGGIGTIIGTPPNAVAVSLLQEKGISISFIGWMYFAVPFVVVLLFFLWALLIFIFKPRSNEFDLVFPEPAPPTWDLLAVVIVFALTVLLWLSGPLHGIPAPVVALIPVVAFTSLKILNREDLKKIEWDVLLLLAGGMTLGIAMTRTGLTESLVHLIPEVLAPALLLAVFGIVTLVASNFMSNTAAANLMLPVAISLGGIEPKLAGIAVAFAASLAMSLPVSTPPNAIAFATGAVETRDLVKYGTMISVIGYIMMLAVMSVIF